MVNPNIIISHSSHILLSMNSAVCSRDLFEANDGFLYYFIHQSDLRRNVCSGNLFMIRL